jgi:hypothetical protein
MARNYYCLVAGLPDIVIDQNKLSFGVDEFKDELGESLHPADYALLELLFLPVDNQNLLNLLVKNEAPFDKLGRYSQDELEENIKEPEGLLPYLIEFIEDFKSDTASNPNIRLDNRMAALYYEYVDANSNEFLRKWFEFDRTLRNILAAYNCRKFELPVDNELIGEGDIVDSLKKSRARDFGISSEVPVIEKVISILENKDLLEREKGLDLIRWNFLDDLNVFNYFTIEVILGFVIKLMIINRWLKLDANTGKELFEKLLEELKTSFEFPIEFNV